MAGEPDEASIEVIPPIWLDSADIHILSFLHRRGPTYHINIAKALPHDIRHISRRCQALALHDLLDRQSRTYYALTEQGKHVLDDADSHH